MKKHLHGFKPFLALPPFFGGKRRLLQWIFKRLSKTIPPDEWPNRTFLDVFAGGCSVSLYAKMHGFKSVLTNDWSARTQIIAQAILCNQNQYLLKEDLLYLSQALPEGIEPVIEQHFTSHILSKSHAQALDRLSYWASQYQNPIKRSLGVLLMWHLVHEYVCLPTSINTSNRPYAETLDGLRDWQTLNAKRFADKSFPRLLKPRWSSLNTLGHRINAGIVGGSPVQAYQMEAPRFLSQTQGDIAYFDPPYPDTLNYESSLKTLDALLFGNSPRKDPPVSHFSKSVDALQPLLENAHHIPVWILSYGNNRIDLEGLVSFVQSCTPDRLVQGYQQAYSHLAHVSKTQERKELLIIATTQEILHE